MAKVELFRGRELTDFERQMREEHRCVCCGQPVEASAKRNRKTGEFTTIWPFECPECKRLGTTHCTGTFDSVDRGPARVSVQHEFKRRLGYRATTASGPRVDVGDDADDDMPRK